MRASPPPHNREHLLISVTKQRDRDCGRERASPGRWARSEHGLRRLHQLSASGQSDGGRRLRIAGGGRHPLLDRATRCGARRPLGSIHRGCDRSLPGDGSDLLVERERIAADSARGATRLRTGSAGHPAAHRERRAGELRCHCKEPPLFEHLATWRNYRGSPRPGILYCAHVSYVIHCRA